MSIRAIVLTCALAAGAHPAAAQGVTLSPSDPKAWDVSFTIGWLGGDKAALAERWNDWYDAFATSIDAGRYWTPHLKTEAGATFTSTGEVFTQRQLPQPGAPPVYISESHRYGVRAAHASVVYQFLENTWVHPFVGAGLHAAWEREEVQISNVFGPGFSPTPIERRRHFDLRPFVTGGAKFYVSERGFIRTDLSSAMDGRGAALVWWRIGGGLDF